MALARLLLHVFAEVQVLSGFLGVLTHIYDPTLDDIELFLSESQNRWLIRKKDKNSGTCLLHVYQDREILEKLENLSNLTFEIEDLEVSIFNLLDRMLRRPN